MVSVYDALVLDANASYDENTGGRDTLTFAWSCEEDGTAVDLAMSSSPVVILDISSLSAGGLFVFSVNVSRVEGGDAAWDVAQVGIEVVASTPPKVSLGAVVGRNSGVYPHARALTFFNLGVNGALKLTLQGTATVDASTTRINGTWSRMAGELYDGAELASVARTSLVGSAFGTLAQDLVLAPYLLVAGATYVFSFTATASNVPDAGYATVTVVVSRPPSAGVAAAAPPKGETLSTRFTLSTSLWVADSVWNDRSCLWS